MSRKVGEAGEEVLGLEDMDQLMMMDEPSEPASDYATMPPEDGSSFAGIQADLLVRKAPPIVPPDSPELALACSLRHAPERTPQRGSGWTPDATLRGRGGALLRVCWVGSCGSRSTAQASWTSAPCVELSPSAKIGEAS